MRAFINCMLISFASSRSYTTHTALLARVASNKSLPAFNLSDFLLRQRVIGLWRDIIRMIQQIPKEDSTRKEMRGFARDEFERNRGATDPVQIRYLVSTGKTQLDQMKKQWRF